MKTTPIPVKRIALREWLILSCLLLILTSALSITNVLGRVDLVFYDHFMQLSTHEVRDDVLIVAIDDFSLNELGKWPWPRQRHADLLKKISAAKPLAIGMDILFAEPESTNSEETPSGDQALADAIKENHRVVLPLVSESAGKGLDATLPIATLANVAQIGHIHIELDQDGVARSVFLREGTKGEWWPHFALAMKNLAQNTKAGSEQYLPGNRLSATARSTPAQSDAWTRDYQMYIPFSGGNGHFQTVPYAAVLRGEVPESFFKNKYVLVGPTAVGMADSFPTPVSSNDGLVSGVEINANILASLLDERSIRFVPGWLILLCNLIILGTALAAYLLLSPRKALASTGVLFVLAMTGSFLLMRYTGWWLPSSPVLCALIIAYPIWSWRRLEAAIQYLGEEFSLLEKEPHLLPEFIDDEQPRQAALTDTLESSINAMRLAANRVRDLRQFVSDSLASLPDATLVTTTDGNVLLSNQVARAYFAGLGIPKVNDALLPYLFAQMSPPQASEQTQNNSFSWWDILDLKHTSNMKQGIEVRDPRQQDVLIKSAPCYNADKVLVGWIVSIINITAIRAAERSRDETLHFISHDMRAPQASILALLEMQKEPATALSNDEFMARIEKASRITLGLADNFVQLARAESQDYRFEEVDFQNVLIDATEEMWSLAKSKNIRIKTAIPDDEYPARIDRSLVTRVLTNLLSNAIKYSPRDTTITCTLALEQHLADAEIVCNISDEGYGIPRAEQNKLFQRFQRFKTTDQPKNDGVGLGMVFVKAVLDRHHAKIDFTSAPNEGSTFNLRFPATLI
ncbi:CHASE2 domain-containing protein [Undibacterium sp. SXout20W]|uniref:CHASE2 domain-containing protein n=1 Tax=Undibacterium sp. SXout20W TaxID=3413051 RepID=UPI003BF1FDA1